MRCLQAAVGAAWCSAVSLGIVVSPPEGSVADYLAARPPSRRRGPAQGGDDLGEHTEIACGEGHTIDLRGSEIVTTVSEWILSGSCTLLGGWLHPGPQSNRSRVTVKEGAVLTVRGTDFIDVRLVATNAQLEMHDASFKRAGQDTDIGNPHGGAIEAYHSHLLLAHVTFSDHRAQQGGAIFVQGGKLVALDCRFDRTRADYAGGAIYADADAVVDLQDSHFNETVVLGDSSQHGDAADKAPSGGGAIAIQDGELHVTNCGFAGTCSVDKGGAILAEGDSPKVNLIDVVFKNTKADPTCSGGEEDKHKRGMGGAIAIFNGSLQAHNSSIEDGFATVSGGAVYAASPTRPVQVIFSASSLRRLLAVNGGAFFQQGGMLAIDEDTHISDCKAYRPKATKEKSSGGVIYAVSALVDISDTTIFNAYAMGDGGAFWQSGGMLNLDHVKINRTKCFDYGGMLFGNARSAEEHFDLQVSQLDMVNCKAHSGGCIYMDKNHQGSVLIESTLMSETKARDGDGGCMMFSKLKRVSLQGVKIIQTEAAADGGAVKFHKVQEVEFHSLLVLNSRSGEAGGAIYMSRAPDVNMSDLRIMFTRAGQGGGLMLTDDSRVVAEKVDIRSPITRGPGAALHVVSGSIFVCNRLKIFNAKSRSQGGAFYVHAGWLLVENVEVFWAEAGLGGATIFAVESRVHIRNGMLDRSNGLKYMLSFSNSTVRFDNVTIKRPLLGQFAAFQTSSVLELEDITAKCAPHSEFMNRTKFHSSTMKYECQECDESKGIIGMSWVKNGSKECYTCPENSMGCDDRGCLCENDFVLNNTQPDVFAAIGSNQCVSCEEAFLNCEKKSHTCGSSLPPQVLNCTSGQEGRCRQVWAGTGAWRLDNSLAAAVECPFRPACSRSERGICQEFYEGPMCMVCKASHFRKGRFRPCRPCNVSAKNDVLFYSGLLALLVALVIGYIHLDKIKECMTDMSDTVNGYTSYIRVKGKQVAFIMQAFSTLQELRFPSQQEHRIDAARMVDNIAGELLPAVSLDVFASHHITKCRLGFDAYECYLFSLAQMVLVFAVILALWKKLKVEVDWLVLTAYNFMLMNVVKESLSFFLCDDAAKGITGAAYLNNDYSIKCSGPRYYGMLMLASIMLFLWCIGIPGFLFWRMYKKRTQLNPRIKAPVGPTDCAPDEQIMAVFTQMTRDYNETMRCYGLSTMLHLTQMQRKCVDTGSLQLSWTASDRAPSMEDLAWIRATSSGSTGMRLDTRKLLKQGLRAVEERRNPSLTAYRNFYRHYNCERWYYEFISIWGRIGYALVMMLPASLQCLAGLLLSGLLLLLTCLLMPFRRRSDNYVGAVCYLAMLGLFGAHTVRRNTTLVSVTSGVCLTGPLLSFIWYTLRAYVLPGRHAIWTAEAADAVFDEEFARARLAPRVRRQQQGVELAVLQSAGLLDKKREARDSVDSIG